MNSPTKEMNYLECQTVDWFVTRFYERTPLKLDISACQFASMRDRETAEAISIATEHTRTKLRLAGFWASPVSDPPRGFQPEHLRSKSARHLVDLLPWPAVLTMDKCCEKAAEIAKCSQESVISQAMRLCSVDQVVLLQNFLGMTLGIQEAARELSIAIKPIKDKQDRAKRSSSVGGKKGAVTRRAKAKTPSPEKLREQRARLIAQGKSERSVAGILAARLGVHPTTIRRILAKPS